MLKRMKSQAHTNIALIKYWGKANPEFNLPTTSSLSMTLDSFYTTTEVSLSEQSQDILILNGEKADATRVTSFLEQMRNEIVDFPKLLISSDNQVATAAGLASSASGFAALSHALVGLLELNLPLEEISRFARMGSGSASRSLFGNFAIWHAGNGSSESSYAESFLNEDVGLSMIVVEVSTEKKSVPSSLGMQLAQSSPDYGKWVEHSAVQLDEMKSALVARDLEKVGVIAEGNALAMHALNRTCKQPFDYFVKTTTEVLNSLKSYRQKGILAFATLDAGPNIKVLTDKNSEKKVLSLLSQDYPQLQMSLAHAGQGARYV